MDSVSSPYQDSGGLSYTMPQKHPRLHWWHKVTHVEIRHRAAEHLLLQRQLRWVGHHAFNSYALKPTPSSCSLRRTSQWSAVAWRSYACGTWTTSVVSWTSAISLLPTELEQLSTDRDTLYIANGLAIIQCVCRSSSWRSTYPQTQFSQPTNYWSDMPTVQPNLCFRVRPHSFIYCIKYRWQNADVNKSWRKIKNTIEWSKNNTNTEVKWIKYSQLNSHTHT